MMLSKFGLIARPLARPFFSIPRVFPVRNQRLFSSVTPRPWQIRGNGGKFAVSLALGSFSSIYTYNNLEIKPFSTFDQWYESCTSLPRGVSTGAFSAAHAGGGTDYSKCRIAPGLTPELVNEYLDSFIQSMHGMQDTKKTSFNSDDAWLDGKAPEEKAYDLSSTPSTSSTGGTEGARDFYAQRVDLPAGSKVIFHGDLHGDVISFLESIKPYIDTQSGFKLKDGVKLVMLGDYVDRGLYGLECICTLLKLWNANPGSVYLVRGNHEDRKVCNRYGFTKELAQKKVPQELVNKIFNWYEMLPTVIYLGSNNNFIHCSHGGFEPKFNPKQLLNAPNNIQFQSLHGMGLDSYNGFMWSDFQVDPTTPTNLQAGRGYCFGKDHSIEIMKEVSEGRAKCVGVVRAHQHGDVAMMNRMLNKDGKNLDNIGVVKLWTNAVCTGNKLWPGFVATFNLCPDTPTGLEYGFGFDTHGILTLGDTLDQWNLEIIRKDVIARQ
jgi:hypothetical protein